MKTYWLLDCEGRTINQRSGHTAPNHRTSGGSRGEEGIQRPHATTPRSPSKTWPGERSFSNVGFSSNNLPNLEQEMLAREEAKQRRQQTPLHIPPELIERVRSTTHEKPPPQPQQQQPQQHHHHHHHNNHHANNHTNSKTPLPDVLIDNHYTHGDTKLHVPTKLKVSAPTTPLEGKILPAALVERGTSPIIAHTPSCGFSSSSSKNRVQSHTCRIL
ncbi:hypothetical protein Pmani_034738 [Petrolisthes manimaculis]|uniref:Uncharacterized protein n=1 Tax=Petrolisthes manimaculis TaxID=1843537 RepID=A0AAE1NN34_9EUCA|nr:hypothetical protein Pmani_034738 [Petrolisthes manimaculis]